MKLVAKKKSECVLEYDLFYDEKREGSAGLCSIYPDTQERG
jgi:hypothetical protein